MENSCLYITDELKFLAEHLFEEFCKLEDEDFRSELSKENVDYEALWVNLFQKSLDDTCDEQSLVYKSATLSLVRIVLESRARSKEWRKYISKDLELFESVDLAEEIQLKLPF